MAAQILRAQDRTSAPWKNGGGMTSEVAVHPRDAGTGDFLWRVSVADVARGGPFSTFPGVDRVITLVDGPGMALSVDGASHQVDTPYEPFAFSGDAVTDCRLLGGAIIDFNVMVRRAEMTARVRIVRSQAPLRPGVDAVVLAVVLDGSAVLRHSSVRLGRLDAVLLSAGDEDSVEVEGVLAIVELEVLPGR